MVALGEVKVVSPGGRTICPFTAFSGSTLLKFVSQSRSAGSLGKKRRTDGVSRRHFASVNYGAFPETFLEEAPFLDEIREMTLAMQGQAAPCFAGAHGRATKSPSRCASSR